MNGKVFLKNKQVPNLAGRLSHFTIFIIQDKSHRNGKIKIAPKILFRPFLPRTGKTK